MSMVALLKNKILFPILVKKNRYNHEEQMVRGGYGRKCTAVETTLCDVNSKRDASGACSYYGNSTNCATLLML